MESKDVSAGLGSLPIDMVNQEPALDLVAKQESGQDAVEEVHDPEDAVEEVHDPEADAAEVNSDDPEADAAEVNSDDLAAAQEGSEDTGEEVNSDVDSLPSVPKWFPTCLTKHLLTRVCSHFVHEFILLHMISTLRSTAFVCVFRQTNLLVSH